VDAKEAMVTRIARDHFLRWRTFAMAALCDGGPSRPHMAEEVALPSGTEVWVYQTDKQTRENVLI